MESNSLREVKTNMEKLLSGIYDKHINCYHMWSNRL